MFGVRYIKAQPTTYLMKYRSGAIVAEGPGLSALYYAPATMLVAAERPPMKTKVASQSAPSASGSEST